MPNIKNQTQLTELQVALKGSRAIIITDHQGMPVSAQTNLKSEIKTAGGRLSVTKNTLLAIALKEIMGDLPEDLKKALEGPSSVLFTGEDPVSPVKALTKFIKDNEDKPVIKAGVMEGKYLSVTDVQNLSKLPGKQELLGMLVGQLNAPIAGFAQVLRANLQNIVFVVDAIKRQKQA